MKYLRTEEGQPHLSGLIPEVPDQRNHVPAQYRWHPPWLTCHDLFENGRAIRNVLMIDAFTFDRLPVRILAVRQLNCPPDALGETRCSARGHSFG